MSETSAIADHNINRSPLERSPKLQGWCSSLRDGFDVSYAGRKKRTTVQGYWGLPEASHSYSPVEKPLQLQCAARWLTLRRGVPDEGLLKTGTSITPRVTPHATVGCW